MAEAVRIIGHKADGESNEHLQAQVYPDGSLAVRISGYSVSDVDESSDPQYYGLVDKDGKWEIIRKTTAGAVRYAAGTANYPTAWTARASQSYDYYYNTF